MNKKITIKTLKPLCFLLILLTFITVRNAPANVAAPSQGGTPAGEPTGLENIYITGETLRLDLRPLGALNSVTDRKEVLVEAVYQVENRGKAQDLRLVFAIGSENAEDFQFRIDGRDVTSTGTVETAALPKSWQLPRDTPWTGDRKLMYNPNTYRVRSVSFSLTIPPGKHTLTARYRSEAAEYRDLEPLKAWQFAYILAPAREWAGFGGLDVSVYLPAGWQAETLPQLTREGDVLTGKFDRIPADALAVTARSVLPANYQTLQTFYNVLFCAAIFVFPVLLILFAWIKGRRLKLHWLYGIGLTVLWTTLVFAAGWQAFYGADATIPKAQFAVYGYGDAFGFLFLLVLSGIILPVGLALWMLTVYAARRLSKEL